MLTFVLGLLIGFIACSLLLVGTAIAQAPTTENEDYFSEDITIKNNALQVRHNSQLREVTETPVRREDRKSVDRRNNQLPASGRNSTCEDYQEIVSKYFNQHTETALFVASKESGCQNIRSHKPNANGTYDYCIFQINNEPSALDIDTCVRRAWEKFKGSKFVWKQWYAVCEPRTRLPKYEGIKCQ